jgi:Family of unknown function (DUF5684)
VGVLANTLAGLAFQAEPLFAQARRNANADADAAAGGIMAGLVIYLVVVLVIAVITIIGMWKVFEKAGQPGWAAIVPFYNMYILNSEIAKKEPMWFILYIVGAVICGPLALIAIIVINLAVAEKFGKGAGYGIGLSFLPFIFYPMLGFGSARYRGGRRSSSYDDYDDEDEEEEERPRKKKKTRDYDDEDDDDRPRGKRKSRDYDDE